MSRDFGGDRYQFTANRGLIELLARRSGLPVWKIEMVLSTDPGMMKGIVRDAQHNPTTASRSMIPEDHSKAGTSSPTPQRSSGWVESQPLVGSVPGTALIDAMFPTTFELEARRKAREEAQRKAEAKE